MICENCKKDLKNTDFILNQPHCYKCMYSLKCNAVRKVKSKEFKCKCCGNKFRQDETVNKRQRNVYCSNECALKGHKQQRSIHWTRVIRDKSLVMTWS